MSLTTWVNVNGALCSPDAKSASEVLLQTSRADDLVTVWLLACQSNRMVSPTDAFTAKGMKRRTPWVGATMTVWVAPVPLLPEYEPSSEFWVDEGGV